MCFNGQNYQNAITRQGLKMTMGVQNGMTTSIATSLTMLLNWRMIRILNESWSFRVTHLRPTQSIQNVFRWSVITEYIFKTSINPTILFYSFEDNKLYIFVENTATTSHHWHRSTEHICIMRRHLNTILSLLGQILTFWMTLGANCVTKYDHMALHTNMWPRRLIWQQ